MMDQTTAGKMLKEAKALISWLSLGEGRTAKQADDWLSRYNSLVSEDDSPLCDYPDLLYAPDPEGA